MTTPTDNEAARARARAFLEDARLYDVSSFDLDKIEDRLTSLLVSHAEELATARAALLDLSNRVASVEAERDEARGEVARLRVALTKIAEKSRGGISHRAAVAKAALSEGSGEHRYVWCPHGVGLQECPDAARRDLAEARGQVEALRAKVGELERGR